MRRCSVSPALIGVTYLILFFHLYREAADVAKEWIAAESWPGFGNHVVHHTCGLPSVRVLFLEWSCTMGFVGHYCQEPTQLIVQYGSTGLRKYVIYARTHTNTHTREGR